MEYTKDFWKNILWTNGQNQQSAMVVVVWWSVTDLLLVFIQPLVLFSQEDLFTRDLF